MLLVKSSGLFTMRELFRARAARCSNRRWLLTHRAATSLEFVAT
jgi:hypothetical protein